jgi:ABC-2 type transport system permease protein
VSDIRPTDRGVWRVVAMRDFWVRLRDKGFVISTCITLAVFSVFILVRAYGGGGTPSFDLGIVVDPAGAQASAAAYAPAQAAAVAAQVEAAASNARAEVRVVEVHPPDAGRSQLRDGSLDGVLAADGTLEGDADVPSQLRQIVQSALVRDRIVAALAAQGATVAEIDAALNVPVVALRTLQPRDPNREENGAIAFIGVLLLYGQLFGYGVWVATGVIEEKSSRVVEILLSAIRPKQLMAGKILGIGLLGIAQLIFIAAFAMSLAALTGALKLPATALGAASLVLAWFVLGFAFYASLFAAAGSLVSRMEELQNVIVPLNLVILVSFFISIGAVQDPDSTLAVVASLLPFSAALAMPVRIVLGSATLPQIVLSVALLIGSTLLLIPLAGRLYAGAVLRTGSRVRLRDAWRSAT